MEKKVKKSIKYGKLPVKIKPDELKNSHVRRLILAVFGHNERPIKFGRM